MNELTVRSEMKNLEAVMSFVNEHLDAMNCSARSRIQIDIAVDEIFGNIVRYAYAEGTAGSVTVRFSIGEDPAEAVITFIDEGKPFDPLTSPVPDTTLPAKKRRIGGLGLFMVKNTMDEVIHGYRDGRNVLTIRKNVRAGKQNFSRMKNKRSGRTGRNGEDEADYE